MRPVRLPLWTTCTLAIIAQAHAAELVYVGTQGVTGRHPAGAEVSAGNDGAKPKQGIYAARLDTQTGALAPIGLVAQIERAAWLLDNPKVPVIYSVGLPGTDLKANARLFSFAVDRRTGSLRPLNSVDAGGLDATHLAIDVHSMSLACANFGSGSVTLFPLQADGSVGEIASAVVESGSGPTPRQSRAIAHGVVFDPTHRFVLSADFGADKIFVYHFDPTERKLTPAATPAVSVPPGSGPRRLAFTSNGRFLIAASELTAELLLYRWDSKSGELQAVQSLSAYPAGGTGEHSLAEMQLSGAGRFLYVSLRGDQDSLVVYAVDQRKGALREIQRIGSGGKSPWSFTIDPSGRWLLVTNQASNRVAELKVNLRSGTLSATEAMLDIPQPVAVAIIAAADAR